MGRAFRSVSPLSDLSPLFPNYLTCPHFFPKIQAGSLCYTNCPLFWP
jgi:hypothetical protein